MYLSGGRKKLVVIEERGEMIASRNNYLPSSLPRGNSEVSAGSIEVRMVVDPARQVDSYEETNIVTCLSHSDFYRMSTGAYDKYDIFSTGKEFKMVSQGCFSRYEVM